MSLQDFFGPYDCLVDWRRAGVTVYALPLNKHGTLLGYRRSVRVDEAMEIRLEGLQEGQASTLLLQGAVNLFGAQNGTGHDYTVRVTRDFQVSLPSVSLPHCFLPTNIPRFSWLF